MSNTRNLPFPRDLLILLLLCCCGVALVNPIGDFPLNDDWAYGLNARALAVENRLFFSDWPAMTLIAHTLWGTLFCKIFGFSFTVLRFSNLLMALFGLASFYQILTWAGVSRRMTWFAVLLLAFNPLWFVLANSYMTDVPFLAVLLWSLCLFLKTLEKPMLTNLLAATFFALWACFVRQLGLLLPGVFLLLFLYYQPLRWRNLLFAALPLAVCYVGVEIFAGWLKATGQLPESYTGADHLLKSFFDNPKVFDAAAERAGVALMTVGLFLLPMSVSIFRKSTFQKMPTFGKFGIGMLLLPAAFCIWKAWGHVPYGNIFFNLGLGPKLLKDGQWGGHIEMRLPDAYFLWIKIAAVIGAVSLLLSLRKSREATERHLLARNFSLWVSTLYLIFICSNWFFMDRHLLPFMAFALLAMAKSAERWSKIGVVLFGIIALFSIVATHDYLAWNRARWQAIGQLTRQGATPAQMDGGFEFNGWHGAAGPSPRTLGLTSWWFVRDDEWVVSFDSIWGYDTVALFPYQRWLPPTQDAILASRRKSYAVRDSIFCDMERLTADSSAFLPEMGNLQPGNANTRSAERARSGQFSMKLTPDSPFGATVALDAFQAYDRLIINVWRYPAKSDGAIIVAADDPENAYFLENACIVERDSAGWGMLEFAVTLPEKAVGSRGKFYLWNTDKERAIWFDDLKFYRLQAK